MKVSIRKENKKTNKGHRNIDFSTDRQKVGQTLFPVMMQKIKVQDDKRWTSNQCRYVKKKTI